jgi:hypothetical protein
MGLFPPSSNVTGLISCAAAVMIDLPVAVLPVKATLSIPVCEASGAPASSPKPVTMFKTPGGRPTSLAMAASSKQVLYCQLSIISTTQILGLQVVNKN